MNKIFLTVIFALSSVVFVNAQETIDESLIEVGIAEKLGETVALDLQFLNEANELVSLREIIDKPTILSFVYFDCPGLCSPLLEGISEVVEKLDMDLGTDYQVVTISFNTNDTPEKAIIKKNNFVTKIGEENRKHWIYLTGEQESILGITESAGFKYMPQGLDFAHPSAIILLSPEGKITRYLYGINFLPFDVKMAVIEAQQGISRPTINRILEYCFAYDPNGRTYTLQVTRIVGGLMIFILGLGFIILVIRGRKKAKK